MDPDEEDPAGSPTISLAASSVCLVPTSTVQDIDVISLASSSFSGRQTASTAISTLLTFRNLVEQRCHDLILQARLDLSLQNWQAAVAKMSRAILLDSKCGEYYLLRGEAFLQMADFQSAIMNFERASYFMSSDAALHHRLKTTRYLHARSLYEQMLYEESLDVLESAIDMDACSPLEYHGCKMSCLIKLDRYTECVALADKLLEDHDDSADLFVARARLHKTCGRDSASFYDLQSALSIDGDHAAANHLLEMLQRKAYELHSHAVRLCLSQKYAEALQKISSAIDADPLAATYHVFRGILHRRTRNFPAAVDDFTVALGKSGLDETSQVARDAHRHLSLTYNELAVDCFLNRYYHEAVLLLNKAIGQEKKDAGMYTNRGDCFYCLGDVEFAMADYRQALELVGGDWSLRGRLAIVNCHLGADEYTKQHYAKSLSYYDEAIAVQPAIAQVYARRARVHFMLKDLESCESDTLAALSLDRHEETATSLANRIFPNMAPQDILDTVGGKAATMQVVGAINRCREQGKVGQGQLKSPDPVDRIIATMPALTLSETRKELLDSGGANSSPGVAQRSGVKHIPLLLDSQPSFGVESLGLAAAHNDGGDVGNEQRSEQAPAGNASRQFVQPRTALSSAIQRGLPGVPDAAMPPLEACLADREFFGSIVNAKKEANAKFGKLLRTKPSLESKTKPPPKRYKSTIPFS